eukprot:scaffold4780_cov113-Cylindrotheca_fusiformis.AAC.3
MTQLENFSGSRFSAGLLVITMDRPCLFVESLSKPARAAMIDFEKYNANNFTAARDRSYRSRLLLQWRLVWSKFVCSFIVSGEQ